MGGSGSKSQSEPENTPEPPEISKIIQRPASSCSTNEDDFSIIEEIDDASNLKSTTSQKPASQQLKPKDAFFKSFIEASINDLDQSIETITNHAKTIIPDGFTNLSVKKLNRCLVFTIESLYVNFDKLNFHRDVISMIFEDARQSNRSEMNFSTAFGRLCRQQIHNIGSDQKWNDIVMFGALLCELTVVYHKESTLFMLELNIWIQEIIKSALSGNDNGLIAYMLILNRLITRKDVFDQINRQYFKILRTLIGNFDNQSKLRTIVSCLITNVDNFNKNDVATAIDKSKPTVRSKRLKVPKHMIVDDAEYLEEVQISNKCKAFEKYLKSTSKGINDFCSFFSDATINEVEYFSRIFIDHAIENPKEIKILGSIASKYQTALLRVRRLIKDTVKGLEGEFETLKRAGNADSVKVGNLGKLLGELYVSEKPIITAEFMTSFLTFLTDNGDITTIASTLKLCGYFYKSKNQKHFDNFMESINVFRSIIEDEFIDLSENYENKEQICKSRLFMPADSVKKLSSLEMVITNVSENKSVSYNYELTGILHMNYKRLIKLVINSLKTPDANVIELAKFLKSLHDFTYKIGNFVKRLKVNLELRVLDMSTDNLQEMKILGMFIAELKNLNVTSNESQKLWLEKAKSLDPVENFEVMEIYVDVVKAMLVNIQIHEYEKIEKIQKFLLDFNKSLESTDNEVTIRIKSKIAQILQNIVIKKVDSATVDLLFKIRHGQRIEGLPKDMPESDPNQLDVQDFAKIFYINAISNHLFTVNFTNSLKFLKTGSKGEKFIQNLRDMLSSNLFPNIYSPDFCESDEAQGTFELILQLFKEGVLMDLEIISFLQVIYELENLQKYKDYASKFTDDLYLLVVRGTRRNARKFSHNLTKYIERVQQKLKELDVEDVEVEDPFKNVEGQDDEEENAELKLKEDECDKEESSDDQVMDIASTKVQECEKTPETICDIEHLDPEPIAIQEITDKSPEDNLKEQNLESKSSKVDNKIDTLSCMATAALETQNHSTATTAQSASSSWQEICNLLKQDQEKDNSLSLILLDQEQHQPAWSMLENSISDEIAEELSQSSKIVNLLTQIEEKLATFSEDSKEQVPQFQELNLNEKAAPNPNLSVENQHSAQINPNVTQTSQNSSQDASNLYQFQSIHSANFNIPGLAESYNEILPVITTNTSHLRRHSIVIYGWSIEDQTLKPQVKELTVLLSTELRKHHKQLLKDVTNELMDELDIIRRAQGVSNHDGKKFSQQRNDFILTCRAVFPLLESRHIYDILDCMLIHINDGNRIVVELFLDVTEGIEDVFSVDCKARNKFLTFCTQVLEYAVKFRNADPRTSKMLKYFKTLKNKPERSQSIESSSTQRLSNSQLSINYVSPWPDKPRRRYRGYRRPRESSQSTQKFGLSRASSQATDRSSQSVQSSRQSRQKVKSSGQSSQNTQTSAKSRQSLQPSSKSSQSLQPSSKSSQSLQPREKSSQSLQPSAKSSQSLQPSSKSSQNVQSSVSQGVSGQVTGKSNSIPSNVIQDPPASLKTDAKVMFYINQLQSTNVEKLTPKISSILAKDFSKNRFMEILLQKGISDEKFINPAIDLFVHLFEENGIKPAKIALADEIGNEFINLCEDGGKLEQKMMNLVKFTLAFDPFLKGSFLFELWSQLLEFVEQDCPNSLKALLLLMENSFEILYDSRDRTRFLRYVVIVFKRKLGVIKDKSLRDKMNKIIRSFERDEAPANVIKDNTQQTDQNKLSSQNKITEPVAKASGIATNPPTSKITLPGSQQQVKAINPLELLPIKTQELDKNHSKVVTGLTKDLNFLNFSRPSTAIEPAATMQRQEVSIKKSQTIQSKLQLQSNIQTHQDDQVRLLNFTPDYFLFDNSITNPQKFEKTLKVLCEKCRSFENNDEHSIKIKEFIAIAIIKINFLQTQVKLDEFEKFAEIFYELYTRTDQTKFMQWILMKFLKAWNLNDQNLSDKMTKIYDRYSKSVLRVKKSFKMSEEMATKTDKATASNNITSKSGDQQILSSTPQKPDNITSNLGVLTSKPKSTTLKSRTITLVFDDLVPKSEKRSNSISQKKSDDVSLKFEDTTLKADNLTSTTSDITSKSGDITSKSSDITSKFGDVTSKSDDLTSKSGEITSKFLEATSKPSITLNTAILSSKSESTAPKSINLTSKSVQSNFFINFMTSLQNLLFDHLKSTTIDVDRDPFLDYFALKKKKAYEIVCDLYFLGLISTQFVVSCIAKMFEYPLIIDKNVDVVVRLMKLVDKIVRIRNKEKNFLEVLKPFWLRLPFGVELMFSISVDKWTVLKNFIQKSLLYRLNAIEFRAFIESLWTELMENPGKFNEIVQIFEDFLEVLGDSFAVLIVDFMENRRNSLEKFPIENILKPISLKYKTSILFAFELFEMGILNCELFSKWLNDKIYGKLVQEHNSEILLKFGQKGLKIDGNLDENLINYYKKLNNFG
ncbi:unnamed protein product [Chironomus riparius]|uniref:Uncharacterized protein n=1 Tax=Chironomus riparius TaxID=315576 RepID=A0A9N9S8Z0_9DIPT|nr:unnamed protein product [Chironomus riparius]